MPNFPKKLKDRLSGRAENHALRKLPGSDSLIDFSSNDYLGFAKNAEIFSNATRLLAQKGVCQNGASGSRLLSGNHSLYADLEKKLAEFYEAESALVFNSGYDANIGFFSSVPQRGDVVFYDELIHASIRDGITMGNAKSYKFKHNDIDDLRLKCQARRSLSPKDGIGPQSKAEVYVVTESVFSMDGDSPNLKNFAKFCKTNGCHFVVDEAHAVGIFGKKGEGLVQQLGLQEKVFARIVTFGKALGCHGAAILGSKGLTDYLVNFARSFMYTTGLPPHSVATVSSAYDHLEATQVVQKELNENILFFKLKLEAINLSSFFIPSNSAIHCCIVSGNVKVKSIATEIQKKGVDIRPILSPTVPEGQERLRFCLHSFNTSKQISDVLQQLAQLINSK